MEKGHKKFIIIGGIILVFIITLIISQSYIKNIKLNNEIENIIEEKNLTKEKNVIDILKSIEIGLTDVNRLDPDVKYALSIYFAISYISILPYVNQYSSHPEIQRLLREYKFLLKFSDEIENRPFRYTGMITRLFGLRLSIKIFPYLMKFYKK